MSFIRRRPRRDGLENELRRNRPEPRADFVRELEARISADVPARRGARTRIGLAGALTAALLVAASVFGGIGYAASSVSHAAHTVAAVITFSPHKVGTVSAAADQYGKVTLCHNGHQISVAPSAVATHLAAGDTLGPCLVFAPTVNGAAANDTLDLSESRANNVIVDRRGNNTITTNNKSNRVTTGSGRDVITTGRGTNLVRSGAGNDTVNSSGKDTIFADAGNDTINERNGKTDFVNCGAGQDTVIADIASLDFVSNNCETVHRAKLAG